MKKKRIIIAFILIAIAISASYGFNYYNNKSPLIVQGYGVHNKGSFFILIENRGNYNVKITDILIDRENIELDLCQSHIQGIPDLENFICNKSELVVYPLPDEITLQKSKYHDSLKPFFFFYIVDF